MFGYSIALNFKTTDILLLSLSSLTMILYDLYSASFFCTLSYHNKSVVTQLACVISPTKNYIAHQKRVKIWIIQAVRTTLRTTSNTLGHCTWHCLENLFNVQNLIPLLMFSFKARPRFSKQGQCSVLRLR